MPLHGKIVVIKRSGGDGTEFPLTATCLFGRKPDCDIRIQLPQVSKEHCRIDLNENKAVILTNLSSVNPTRVNGEVLQQSERLKHGDVITIIDRSFRFEYPPAPTPKKRSSIGGKTETFKVLQDQQVGDTVTTETKEKRIPEVSADPHLKDGTNHDNIQRSLEKTVEVESKEDDSLLQNKTTSPFNDLYQMIKQSLDVKTPRNSSASLFQTPTSKFCTPKPGSVKKSGRSPKPKTTPKKDEAKVTSGADETKVEVESNVIPMSSKKQRKSFQVPSTEMARIEAGNTVNSPQREKRATPQRFTVGQVIEQVSAQTPKSPLRRRSKETTPGKPSETKEQEKKAVTSSVKESPNNSGKVEKVKQMSKKRKSGELAADLPSQQAKRKRVSFGGQLSPELFDKRLPPDSPLRRGATPRRSSCLLKSKQSVLRRASVIGLLQEHPDSPNVRSPAKMRTPSPAKKSPKSRPSSPKAASPAKKSPKSSTPSPKTATPGKKSPVSKNSSPKAVTPGTKSPKSRSLSPKAVTPGTKSTKSRTPSPKAVTPGKKSPNSRTPSPKAVTPGKKLPKSNTPSPKAVTPGKKLPKSRTPSPKATSPATKSSESKSLSPTRGRSSFNNKAETPKDNEQLTPGVQTPTVRGRFSVSLIRTPPPIVQHAVTDQVPLVTVTPKLPLRRKSMKSTSRKTQSMTKSAVKVMCRRSGISRASMKALSSWANIVKFGQTKVQVDAPAKKMVTKKMKKKAVPKPRTPARKLKGHASTGHADSPVTIVVGRAHQQKVVHSTGAAPRLVTNTACLKKNMKMDEDLTGISEMFKTPVNERKTRSVINNSAMKTPQGGLGPSVVDPSVLNTPEEPGEMVVSPLSVSSTVKDKKYNCEAVQRLLNGDQVSSFLSDVPPAVETDSDSSEQQCTDMKMTSAPTPKQKPELPDCLTGVKRIMKTPRQKSEPVEDLRGRLLKTPKQKPEQQECLTGVKRIFETPQQEAEPLQDLQGKPLETPKALEAGDVSRDGVEEIMETSTCVQESEGPSEMTDMRSADVSSSPLVCLTGVKRLMKTPKEKNAPVEDMVGVKRLMKTPREKIEPVEDNFGLKRLLKSPRMRDNAPVEDFEGLKELMEESLADPTGQLETNEVDDETPLDCDGIVAKELDFALEEPQDDVSSDVIDVPLADGGKDTDANEVVGDEHLEEEPSGHDNDELSDAMETISQAAVDENLPVEETKLEAADANLSEDPKVDTVDETVSEEQPKMEAATGKVTETDTTAGDPDHEKTSARSRRGKTVESKSPENKQEAQVHSEDPVVPTPVRGRRGRKNEVTAPPAVRQTSRRKNPKTTESGNVEPTVEESLSLVSNVARKPTRGRNAKKSSDDKVEAEMVQEIASEMMPESENDKRTPVDVSDSAAPLETAVLKPKRGRKPKQPEKSVPEQQDVPFTQSDDVPQADMAKEVDANKVSSGQLEVLSSGSDENESNAMKTVPQVPASESVPEVETATCKVTEIEAAIVQKKSVRGRKVKIVQSTSAEDKEEVTEHSEDPVVPAPVRGRRGKKTEAAALPAVRQTRGSRNVKSQESSSNFQPEIVPEKAAETTQVSEIITEAVNDQTSPVNTHEGENGSAPSAEETGMKPTRGRKTKKSVEPIQPDKNEVVTDEHPMTNDQPQKSIPSLEKPRRGRKTKPDIVEQSEAAEDTVLTVEAKQQPQPPVRAKRGRNAKVVEEKLEINDTTTSDEILKSQEPVKKLRRTRMAEQEHLELKEIQTAEMVVPEEAEVPLVAEPVKMNELDVTATRTTRGGRKAKKGTETKTLDKFTEVQEVPAASSMDKPKRGRRGKQVTDEVAAVVPEEKTNHELETEKKKDEEADPPVIKSSRARGVKTEVSLVIPAKRARRGATPLLEETNEESTVLVSQSMSSSAESGKRGRRAAAKPVKDNTVTSDQANPTEDLGKAVKEDTQKSKRSVKWKNDNEVFEILNVTPVKATRGRKSKLGDQGDAKSQNVSKNASKTEEKDLSDTVAEAQPAKRARRGTKVVDVTSDKDESTSKVKSVEAETQPKTRRGRSAKK